ncbi:hypothetical protein NVP1232O_72 [Vibrio phage 1.232.O._10N.261.51.E11]|nr:hypothetical protein NVP1232O_72 [Vibrio phage 1.232.O._10N.261.51.E11]
MKHKHYDMIVAKAENMDLVLFIKLGEQWQATGCHDNKIINIASHYDYFLCLPRHKEVCLHWLNGGEIECLEGGTWLPFRRSHEWKKEAAVMNPSTKIRIKPKKEKRWVIECNGALLSTRLFTSESSAQQSVGESGYSTDDVQFIEIEVK